MTALLRENLTPSLLLATNFESQPHTAQGRAVGHVQACIIITFLTSTV